MPLAAPAIVPWPAAGRVVLRWSEATDGTAPYSYQVERAPDSGGSPGAWAAVGSAVTAAEDDGTYALEDSGLTDGVLHHYRLVATDDVAASATSAAVGPVRVGFVLGVNWPSHGYYTSQIEFIDVRWQATAWSFRNADGSPVTVDPGDYPALDAAGWPIGLASLPAGAGMELRAFVNHQAPVPAGDAALTWEGTGTVVVKFPGAGVADVTDSTGAATATIPGFLDRIDIRIDASDPADHVRNLRLILPGEWDDAVPYSDAPAGRPSPQWWLDALAPFGICRLMDPLEINSTGEAGSPANNAVGAGDLAIEDWAQGIYQPKAGDDYWEVYQGSTTPPRAGLPPELLVRSCTQAGVDPWICLHHRADDSYCDRIAQAIVDELGAGRRVYFELSNEVWNFGFYQFTYFRDEASAAAESAGFTPSTGDWTAGLAFRTWQVFTRLDATLAGLGFDLSRRCRVVAGQHVSPAGSVDPVLAHLDGRHGSPYDAIGGAPYLELADVYAAATAGADAAGLRSACRRSATEDIPAIGGFVDDWITRRDARAAALGRPILHLSYEGGQHIVGSYVEPDNVDTWADELQRWSGMRDLYLQFLDDQRGRGSDGLVLYNLSSPPSIYGAWGLLESWEEMAAGSPWPAKYQAVVDDLAYRAGDLADPVPPLPTAVSASGVIGADQTVVATTAEAATAVIVHGPAADLAGATAATMTASPDTAHSVALSYPATVPYYYQVEVADAEGNVGYSGIRELAPALVVDDADAGFSATAGWVSESHGTYYAGSGHYAAAGAGSEVATWTAEVPAGRRYRVSATWPPGANRATDASYTVLDGATPIGTYAVDQEQAPASRTVDGWGWHDLATFACASGTVVVELSDDADQFVIADAIRVEDLGPAVAEGYTLSADDSTLAAGATTTLRLAADGATTAQVTFSPSAGSVSPNPVTLDGTNEVTATYTAPGAAATATITPSSDGGLADPAAVAIDVSAPAATAYTLTGPATVPVGAARTLTLTPDGDADGVQVTLTPSAGTCDPNPVAFSGSDPATTVYTAPATAQSATIAAADDGGLDDPAELAIEVVEAAAPTPDAGDDWSTYLAVLDGLGRISEMLPDLTDDRLLPVPIDAASSGANELLPGISGKRIVVLRVDLIPAEAVTIAFEDSLAAGRIAGLTGPYALAANQRFDRQDPAWGFIRTRPGAALILDLSGAVRVGGLLTAFYL